MRNMWPAYRGGAYSRAGTMFVGFSKQTGRSYPPRLITFQFSLTQGLALEFGNFYMRVISDGAFVVESPYPIAGITQANPMAISLAPTLGVASVTSVLTGGVTNSYDGGDMVMLAGGAAIEPGVLEVLTTGVLSAGASVPGAGYVPGDSVTTTGGTFTTAAVLKLTTTQVSAATVAAAGSGGTNGVQTVTGTTGTGTPFQASVQITAGAIASVIGVTFGGSYTVNPTTLTDEPVTGAGLAGAALSVSMGANAVTITAAGDYAANPTGNTLTQGSTTGGGTGATFFGLFAPLSASVSLSGVYTTFPASPAAQASTTGLGFGATFDLTSVAVATNLSPGDWIYVSGVLGTTQVNGNTYVIQTMSGGTIESVTDVYGDVISSATFSAYVSGGTVARIYTLVTPYAEADLKYLKVVQSANEMSQCLVNQSTRMEYPPQELSRVSDTNWTIAPLSTGATVAPPASLGAVATTAGLVYYAYLATSVNPVDGTESNASMIVALDAIDLANVDGSITISWSGVTGVNEYNVYEAPPSYDVPVPAGSLFGYKATVSGTRYTDDGSVTPDFTQTPPLHVDPFAPGAITGVDLLVGGAGYLSATAAITTSTGSGADVEALVNTTLTPGGGGVAVTGGPVSGFLVPDGGEDYRQGDQVTVTGPGGGGALAQLQVGPETGTYPSVPGYFQQRRAYANTLNAPDTYFMSQPGSYSNFDSRVPTIPSDAITGSPWGVQVNGIQWLIQTSGGLLVMTGSSAWLLAGVGSFATNVQPISPSTQNAVPQAFSGVSATVPPIKVNYDVLYVESKGSFYYDLPYQLYTLSEPIDLTELAAHLFTGYTIVEHAWCEQPNKLLWSVRSDGSMLSLTYYKTQQVAGWALHVTQGYFESVCSVTEPPVDALYLATERYPGGRAAYMIERMDDRIWAGVEECWCVDAGLALAQPAPGATLTAGSATGLGSITGVTGLVGGENYSAFTRALVVDDNGEGAGVGAVPTLTIVDGAIENVAFAPGYQGEGYSFPAIVIHDPTGAGSGASAQPVLNNAAAFSANAAVFGPGSVGQVIRAGGGLALVTEYVNVNNVWANVLSPIVDLIPGTGTPAPQPAGSWTLSPVVSRVTIPHLPNTVVTGLADGNVIPPAETDAFGNLTLPTPASAVTVGLGFTAQLQSIYLDAGSPTVQGQRKKVAQVTARVEASRDLVCGANQPDGSTLSPAQVQPAWGAGGTLAPVANKAVKPYNAIAAPLYTADSRLPIMGGFATNGQVALQQSNPLPMQILALIPEILEGDTPENQASPRQQARGR